ncbi:MAG: hypothetical protein DI630_35585 [Gordonia sp. (in: high G+C Gram-positive bacteria)]|nr:MAG: hypothetical protein DI630_35585 [Gordonia sp. (in: high G+C Gram-positive bacteria)]
MDSDWFLRIKLLGRRCLRWLQRSAPAIGACVAILLIAAFVAGAFGAFGRGIELEAWLSGAATMLAAVTAALVAVYVLNRQERAADERHRKSQEIAAAAELAAYIGAVWRIADSKTDMRKELPKFTLPSNASSELHRLAAVWISYLDEGTIRSVPTGQSDVLRAVTKFADQLSAGIANGRDPAALSIMESTEKFNIFDDVLRCHAALQDVGRQVVMMPWWNVDDRADTLREWMEIARALPVHLRFVGTHSDRLPGGN